MPSLTLLLAALVATAHAATAAPVEESQGIPGYNTVDIQWEFQPNDGGSKLYLNGTVEQVQEELARLHPDWEEKFEAVKEDTVKRTTFNWNDVVCGKWASAEPNDAKNSVNYLRKVPGRPANGPGPGNCGRVACTKTLTGPLNKGDGGSIWWCNDERSTKTLASFGSICDGADIIINKCSARSPTGKDSITTFVSGQAFHPTNWNVIVRGDKC